MYLLVFISRGTKRINLGTNQVHLGKGNKMHMEQRDMEGKGPMDSLQSI